MVVGREDKTADVLVMLFRFFWLLGTSHHVFILLRNFLFRSHIMFVVCGFKNGWRKLTA